MGHYLYDSRPVENVISRDEMQFIPVDQEREISTSQNANMTVSCFTQNIY